MSRRFKFADVGEGISEGELVKWLVKEGDTIKEDQIVAEVETDKAVVELPSPYAGTVEKIHHQEGETIRVGEVLISVSGDEEAKDQKKEPVEKPPVLEHTKKGLKKPISNWQAQDRDSLKGPALASPHTRRVARERGVDLEAVAANVSGIISESDVKRFAEGGGHEAVEISPSISGILTDASRAGAEVSAEDIARWGPIDRVPLKGTRRKIAQHMTQAMLSTAPVTYMDEVDVENLLKIKNDQKKRAAEKGIKLSLLPFIMRAVETGLKHYPSLNASLIGNEIIYKNFYNFGFAVDTEDGLIVPVVKEIDGKSILQLARELQDLSDQARTRKIEIANLKGSSFTITNLGSIGGRYFTPIINYPDGAILGLGRVYEKPVVKNGHVVTKPMMSLNLTFDHRVTDGATGARFINYLIKRIENPQQLFLDLD
jgi:pyruvate dehydrogenase E2 component (dihydrolipoamide acetyltransferase)